MPVSIHIRDTNFEQLFFENQELVLFPYLKQVNKLGYREVCHDYKVGDNRKWSKKIDLLLEY